MKCTCNFLNLILFMSILSWNMRGFRANKEELSVLLKSPPAVVCLQETLVTENNTL